MQVATLLKKSINRVFPNAFYITKFFCAKFSAQLSVCCVRDGISLRNTNSLQLSILLTYLKKFYLKYHSLKILLKILLRTHSTNYQQALTKLSSKVFTVIYFHYKSICKIFDEKQKPPQEIWVSGLFSVNYLFFRFFNCQSKRK